MNWMPGVAKAAAFDFIRYSNVWEDADLLCKALRPVAKGGRLLSIASSGDNVLALLTLDPKEVVAADLNLAQLACLELRLAAFKRLADSELLGFLGVETDLSRLSRYAALRADLSPQARQWWDGKSAAIEAGVIHMGKFERYLTTFGRVILPLLQPGPWRKALLELDDPKAQSEIYAKRWDHPLWRGAFRVFFSRFLMGALGRDSAFFAQVQGSVGERILERTRQALALPAASNPYLTYITRGNFRPGALPLYLRPKNRALIRKRLDRVTLFQGPIQAAPGGRFDGFNLSDIFEYMKPEEHRRCYAELLRRANPQARLAYWNLLVPRTLPQGLKARRLGTEALALHAHDQAWFYTSFELDEARA